MEQLETTWRPDLEESSEVIAQKAAKKMGIIEGMEYILNAELGGNDE